MAASFCCCKRQSLPDRRGNAHVTYTSRLVVALAVPVQGASIAADGEEDGENDGGDLHLVWCLGRDEKVLSRRRRWWLMAMGW